MSEKNISQLIESELNPAQKQATLFNEGPLLLIAGAGSGKTKTLVYRVARLINDGVPAEQILLLTFTRKAAEEMLKRAANILDERCRNVSGGTFHAFANVSLRKFASHIGYDPQFTILDRADAEDLIQTIRKAKGLSATEKRFPKKGTIANIIGKAINTSTAIEKIISQDYPQFIPYANDIEQVAIEYELQKRQMQVMDYDDLLLKLLELFTLNPDIQEKFKNHYQYILVDEYQDTNTVQAQIIKALVNQQQNIMVVGDDSQSIYSFRGAHFENIMKFPELFPAATIIKLEQNYRSTQPILDLTNAVIQQAQSKYTKHLFTDNDAQNKPILVETDSENAQSEFICKKILELRETGIELNEIAILIRSGWHSNDLELELKSHDIPFIKMGGFKFVETSHIKDITAYFRIIANPTDTISWNRILLMLEGCGPGAAKKITDQIKQNPQELSFALSKHANKKYYKDLEALIRLVSTKDIKTKKPTDIYQKISILYKPLFRLKYDDFNKRQTDIDSFEPILERYHSLEILLTEMSLDPPTDTQAESVATSKDNERISLSTIHSAKGLEWHTVFILSAIDGYLPSFQSMGDINQLEEERRLMYVALTRAKENLFICKPNLDLSRSSYHQFSGMQFSKVSRFLEEFNIIQNFTEKQSIGIQKQNKGFSLPSGNYENVYDPDKTFNQQKNRKYYF